MLIYIYSVIFFQLCKSYLHPLCHKFLYSPPPPTPPLIGIQWPNYGFHSYLYIHKLTQIQRSIHRCDRSIHFLTSKYTISREHWKLPMSSGRSLISLSTVYGRSCSPSEKRILAIGWSLYSCSSMVYFKRRTVFVFVPASLSILKHASKEKLERCH